MTSFKAFIAAYLISLAAAIFAGIYVLTIVLPWPGLVMMWVLILFGFGLYWRAYVLTSEAVRLQGTAVEQNPVARFVLVLHKFNLALVIMLAVQTSVGMFAVVTYLQQGLFYTLFLTFEIVAFTFIFFDWLNDELQMMRFRSRQQSAPDRVSE